MGLNYRAFLGGVAEGMAGRQATQRKSEKEKEMLKYRQSLQPTQWRPQSMEEAIRFERAKRQPSAAKIRESMLPNEPIRVAPLKVGNFWQTRKPEFADKASVDYASTLRTIGNVMKYFDNKSLLEKEGKNIREINDYVSKVVIPGMTMEQKEFLRKKGYLTK